MSELTKAQRDALDWIRRRGGDVAVCNVKGGGRIYLACGEHAPFLPISVKSLEAAGMIEFYEAGGKPRGRFRLTEAGKSAA